MPNIDPRSIANLLSEDISINNGFIYENNSNPPTNPPTPNRQKGDFDAASFTLSEPPSNDLTPGLRWIADNYPGVYEAHTIHPDIYSRRSPLHGSDSRRMIKSDLAHLLSKGTTDLDKIGYEDTIKGYQPFASYLINEQDSDRPNSRLSEGLCMLISYPNAKLVESDGKLKVKAVLISEKLQKMFTDTVSALETKFNVKVLTNATIENLVN